MGSHFVPQAIAYPIFPHIQRKFIIHYLTSSVGNSFSPENFVTRLKWNIYFSFPMNQCEMINVCLHIILFHKKICFGIFEIEAFLFINGNESESETEKTCRQNEFSYAIHIRDDRIKNGVYRNMSRFRCMRKSFSFSPSPIHWLILLPQKLPK